MRIALSLLPLLFLLLAACSNPVSVSGQVTRVVRDDDGTVREEPFREARVYLFMITEEETHALTPALLQGRKPKDITVTDGDGHFGFETRVRANKGEKVPAALYAEGAGARSNLMLADLPVGGGESPEVTLIVDPDR